MRTKYWPRTLIRSRIPFVPQQASSDSGLASLVMVLRSMGKKISLGDLHEVCQIGRDGIDLDTLKSLAEQLGVSSRSGSSQSLNLALSDYPIIVSVRHAQWCVIHRTRYGKFMLSDPSSGRRKVSEKELFDLQAGEILVLRWRRLEYESKGPRSALADLIGSTSSKVRVGPWALAVVVTSVTLQITMLMTPILIQWIMDHALSAQTSRSLPILFVILASLSVVFISATFLRAAVLLRVRERFDFICMSDVVGKTFRLPLDFFYSHSRSDLLARLNTLTRLRLSVPNNIFYPLLDGIFVLSYLAWLAHLHLGIASVVFVLCLIETSVLWFTSQRQIAISGTLQQHSGAQAAALTDAVMNIEYLKAIGAEQFALDQWKALFKQEIEQSSNQVYLGTLVSLLTGFCTTVGPFITMWYATTQVAAGHLTKGAMLASISIVFTIFWPLQGCIGALAQIYSSSSTLDRLEPVLRHARVCEQSVALAGKIQTVPDELAHISVKSASFSFPGARASTIKNVSVFIKAGQTVALVGETGSGKSTLGALLTGTLFPTSGAILINGVPSNLINQVRFRDQVSVVLQNAILVRGSIIDNVRFGNLGISLVDVEEACKRACIHKDILRLPRAYETVITDGGSTLSGGQRQRLALARAFARRPKLLLLDEATSSLDAITECNVAAAIAEIQCTQIIIAHRLSTIRRADLIFVLDQGQIIQSGSFESLSSNPGRFQEMLAHSK